ncbi:MAG: hypothetical protein ACTSO3_15985 [Candidatus Heimdallarchaeaceae archaeon]
MMIRHNNKVSDKQLRKAQTNVRLKKALELLLYRKLLKLFRDYADKYSKAFRAGLFIPDLVFFRQKLEKILRFHYQIVSERFDSNLVNEIGKPDNHSTILHNLKSRTDVHNEIRLADSSQTITETTQKDAFNAFQKAKKEALAAGIVLTNLALARKARVNLVKTFHTRITTISITETQNPAEHTKFAEALHLVDAGAVEIPNKQWITMRDALVREMHAEAYSQIVPFRQPFDVGGQQLMYPGDQSLGATLDNVINCRCELSFIF